jgi:hypothetical protein
VSNILGPPKGYITLLDEATTAKLTADNKSGAEYQKTPLRPSAAGKCTRELYYELMQFHKLAKYETEVRPPNVHRLLSLGHSIEWSLLKQFDLLKNMFEVRYKQQVLSFAHLKAKNKPELSQWLEGSLDLVLFSEKYKCVADVKSKGDGYDFQARKPKWAAMGEKLASMRCVETISPDAFWVEDLETFLADLKDPFFEANFLQLNMYANSDFLMERGIDHGAIIQYRKNDSALREVRFKPSRPLFEQTIAKFQKALDAVDQDDDELASRDYSPESFKCRYCAFHEVCWDKKPNRGKRK